MLICVSTTIVAKEKLPIISGISLQITNAVQLQSITPIDATIPIIDVTQNNIILTTSKYNVDILKEKSIDSTTNIFNVVGSMFFSLSINYDITNHSESTPIVNVGGIINENYTFDNSPLHHITSINLILNSVNGISSINYIDDIQSYFQRVETVTNSPVVPPVIGNINNIHTLNIPTINIDKINTALEKLVVISNMEEIINSPLTFTVDSFEIIKFEKEIPIKSEFTAAPSTTNVFNVDSFEIIKFEKEIPIKSEFTAAPSTPTFVNRNDVKYLKLDSQIGIIDDSMFLLQIDTHKSAYINIIKTAAMEALKSGDTNKFNSIYSNYVSVANMIIARRKSFSETKFKRRIPSE